MIYVFKILIVLYNSTQWQTFSSTFGICERKYYDKIFFCGRLKFRDGACWAVAPPLVTTLQDERLISNSRSEMT